jgi:hypothetical protein
MVLKLALYKVWNFYYVNYHFYSGRALIARIEKFSVLNIFLGLL